MSELANIPSNFDINDWLNVDPSGNASVCNNFGSSTSGGDEGKLRFVCDPSHLAYDDPIVFPGQPGAAHLHQFYGNTLTNHSSDYSTLRTTGSGTCAGGPVNRTGYWQPAMIRPQNNKVVKPAWIELYYSGLRKDAIGYTSPNAAYGVQNPMQGHPRGMQLVFGWQSSDGTTPFGVWYGVEGGTTTCGQDFALHQTYQGTLAALATLCPGITATDNIISRIESAQCWDGINLAGLTGTPGRGHVVHASQDGFGNLACPSTHPNRLPTITILAAFNHEGPADFSQWYLSSDNGHGAPAGTYAGGLTFHADWFGAWDTTISEGSWEIFHLGIGTSHGAGTMRDSYAGFLCNTANQQLDESFLDFTTRPTGLFLPEADRYLDIPTDPDSLAPTVHFRLRRV